MAAGGLELEGVVKARSSEERVAPNDACLPSDARHAPFSTEVISRESGPSATRRLRPFVKDSIWTLDSCLESRFS